jgi:uncharacterized protein YdiU (UPF0061 family)
MGAPLHFDNLFLRRLPGDATGDPRRRQVREAYARVAPTPVADPKLIAFSPEVAEDLGLAPRAFEDRALVEALAGNRLLEGMEPWASTYGGHQFGNWAGQLGDGRAISLGEVERGDRRFELQLKGAGPTPFSRRGDGRAVMRSSVREFLCSEAMHHLGVPTTRALSLVGTGDDVVRDMFYDGHPKAEPGAIVCRVAPTFIRFGSFEIFSVRDDVDTLKTLADHVIATFYPELGAPSKEVYVAWLETIVERTAAMLAEWMRVGFVHGVMNTDNMSILGLTIDYGPYGWLDDFDPMWTPNTTDAQGRRYRYGAQPQIGFWNLVRFANAIYPLVGEAKPLEDVLNRFPAIYDAAHRTRMAAKLGVEALGEEDDALVEDLYGLLQEVETDMTIYHRRLADVPTDADADAEALLAPLREAFYVEVLSEAHALAHVDWLRRWAARVRPLDAEARRARMHAANPKYVLRNYLAQLAIDEAEKGDGSKVMELLEVMRRPYDEQPEREAEYAGRRPEWARDRPGCSMLSCSS